MKKLIFFFGLVLMTSCEVIIVEPVYDNRDRITGSFSVKEYSQTYDQFIRFSVSIYKSGYSGKAIMIDNFYNAGIQVDAELSGNQIYIPWQIRDGFSIEGSGSVYGEELRLSYTVIDTYDRRKPADYCDSKAWLEY